MTEFFHGKIMYFTIFNYSNSIRSNLQFIKSMDKCLFCLKIKSPYKYLNYIWSCLFASSVIVKKSLCFVIV